MINLLKPVATLCIVTVLTALILGVSHEITLEPIARQKAKKEAETVSLLLPGTEETVAEDVEDNIIKRVTTCYQAGGIIGYALLAAPKGYSGAIEMMVALDETGVIKGVRIVGHTETPGLGANATQSVFTDQFKGKSGSLRVVKSIAQNEDEIEAITSATITTDAVVVGTNAATAYFDHWLRP